MKDHKMHRTGKRAVALWPGITIFGFFALVCCWPRPVHAEKYIPGLYRGTYRVTRWGQHRFSFLFVDPKLAPQLQPFAGQPVCVDVKGILQEINPGPGRVTKIEKIEKLPQPVEIKIEWITPPEGLSPLLRQIEANGEAKIRATVTNRSGADLTLNGDALHLVLTFNAPSGAGITDGMDWWSHHDASLCERPFNLPPKDAEIDMSAMAACYSPYNKGPNEVLKPNASFTWTLAMQKWPINEFEVTVSYRQYDQNKEWLEVQSNALRLDSLSLTPRPWDGLKVSISEDAAEAAAAKDSRPVVVRFENKTDKTIVFGLQKSKKTEAVDLTYDLLAYDKDGASVLPPIPDQPIQRALMGGFETIRLKAGGIHTVPMQLPATTKLARVAFYPSLCPEVSADEHALEHGFLFSQHLQFKEKK